MMIIEWNAHMFSRDVMRYPFHADAAYVPESDRLSADPLADYLDRMDEYKIDHAVLVHPEPYGDDHRLVLDCLERQPERFHATCLFYPKDPTAPDKLAALVRNHPRIVALRFHAHRGTTHYLTSFQDEGVRNLWSAAADLNLIVELHIGPNFALDAGQLIAAFPTTTVLIDHLAEPQMGSAVEYANILDLARFDNTLMKLSGLNHFSQDAPLYLDAKPFTRRVVDAFGPDRMVWGSGTPAIVDAHLAHLSEEARDKVKGDNLARLLHL